MFSIGRPISCLHKAKKKPKREKQAQGQVSKSNTADEGGKKDTYAALQWLIGPFLMTGAK